MVYWVYKGTHWIGVPIIRFSGLLGSILGSPYFGKPSNQAIPFKGKTRARLVGDRLLKLREAGPINWRVKDYRCP